MAIMGGRVIDPGQGIDRDAAVLIKAGTVQEVTRGPLAEAPEGFEVMNASGQIVVPGFIDVHTHLREPGEEHKETIQTGTSAAARGGFTTICAMPNTTPCMDNANVIRAVLQNAAESGAVRVLPIGAVSRGREGKRLAAMGELAEAGVIGFSDDGDPISDSNLMRQALAYSRDLQLPIMNHPEEKSLTRGAQMNEGRIAYRLGLTGWPNEAESAMVARDIELAALTGGRLHECHVSTREAVELIRRAKDRGIAVTAEVTPHHLTLTEDWVLGERGDDSGVAGPGAYDTSTKVNPPLRTREDVLAVVAGLADGTIDMVATDHAPHARTDKQCTYEEAANGIAGLETALAAVLSLVHRGDIDLPVLIERMTAAPARFLGRDLGTLRSGYPADAVVFDPDIGWTVEPATMATLGKNTPLAGIELRGKVTATISGGRVVWKAPAEAPVA